MITEKAIEAHLVNFFRAYLEFAETGDNPLGFNTYDGLCICKYRYVDNLGMLGDDARDIMTSMHKFMEDAFLAAGMCPDYPFGMRNYLQRYNTHTQHECPIRLQFIRDFLAGKAP